MRAPLFSLVLFSGIVTLTGCGGGNEQPTDPILPPVTPSNSLRYQLVAQQLTAPVFLTAPSGDVSRAFVVQQGGSIQLIDLPSGNVHAIPFLDIANLITSGGERGLLGLAFDPSYAANGRFYIHYTNVTGDIVIARYLRSALSGDRADPTSAVPLVTIPHAAFPNHNGGMLAFGPDGCLYAGVGDGGGVGDPNNRAQDLSQLLGKILRLDPETGRGCANGVQNPFGVANERPEVWSFGLRNPWRFSSIG